MYRSDSIIEEIGIKDILFSIVMILAVIVITDRWLSRFGESDPAIIVASAVLVGALAAMILSVDLRLRRIENLVESGDRSLRSSIQDVEDTMDKKLNVAIQNTNNRIAELSKRLYR
jgi:ABC-type nickel/cobalt efflux system permease component RcnA